MESNRPLHAIYLSLCGNCYLAAEVVLIASLSCSTVGNEYAITSVIFTGIYCVEFLEIPFTDLTLPLFDLLPFTACTYIKYMPARVAVQCIRRMEVLRFFRRSWQHFQYASEPMGQSAWRIIPAQRPGRRHFDAETVYFSDDLSLDREG